MKKPLKINQKTKCRKYCERKYLYLKYKNRFYNEVKKLYVNKILRKERNHKKKIEEGNHQQKKLEKGPKEKKKREREKRSYLNERGGFGDCCHRSWQPLVDDDDDDDDSSSQTLPTRIK